MKNPTCRGVFTKNQYREEDYLKREAWTVCRFRRVRGLLKKEWGGDYEGKHTVLYVYVYFLNNFFLFFINKNMFFSFSFLFCDEISNNRKRILTNQKPEQVIRN